MGCTDSKSIKVQNGAFIENKKNETKEREDNNAYNNNQNDINDYVINNRVKDLIGNFL